MEAIEDRLFDRWCRRGDAEALGELFDLAAPRLLRLAIHIVGDPAEAEDLVQATFLAAIEQRTAIDSSRPAMPWLTAVLARKGRDARRRAARVPDAGARAEPVEPDASLVLERRELSAEIAAGIERVEEPYRQVLLLRLRHGLAPADIAHVLGTNPGTVRVQLHRGLDKLRQLLPATLASSLLVGLAAPRGLAFVKTAVLRQAAASLAVGTTATFIGGLLMTKKALLIAAAAAVLVGLILLNQQPVNPSTSEIALEEQAVPENLLTVEHPISVPTPGTEERVAALPAPQAHDSAGWKIRGTVLDGQTREGIVGARVRIFAPRSSSLSRLALERTDLFQVQVNGGLMPRGAGDWPRIEALSTLARFDRESVLVYDEPGATDEPLAEGRSGADGTFELPSHARGGILVCDHERYGRRIRAAFPGRAWAVALWPERTISGRVLDVQGKPIGAPLRVVLFATVPGGTGQESLGIWAAETRTDGCFEVKVAAPTVRAETSTPGWRLTNRELDPADGQTSILTDTLDPKPEGKMLLFAERVPAFRFLDAQTRKPIERVRLLGREQVDQYVRWSGEFAAPEGFLTLPGDGSFLRQFSSLRFSAWSAGYREAFWNVPDPMTGGILEVLMEKGEAPRVEGIVLREGQPVEGALVALVGRSPMQWRADEDCLIDAAETSSEGRFRLEAASGSHLLRVTPNDEPFSEMVPITESPGLWEMRILPGREPYFEQVELPGRSPVVIDLARVGTIAVEVLDAGGRAQPAHTVVLRGKDGRSLWSSTDLQGRTRFTNLPPGAFRIVAPEVSTPFSFVGGVAEEVELARGETRSIGIVVPSSTGPRHARVVTSEVVSFEGWRGRADDGEWRALLADGSVPVDLAAVRSRLEVSASDSRLWRVPIPKDAPDGFEIRLDSGAGRYRGVLFDASGAPLAGIRILAIPSSRSVEVETSCITDGQGRFELTGLATCNYWFSFHSNPGAVWRYDAAFNDISFHPSAPPSETSWLEIRLERADWATRIRGVVRHAADSTPAKGALVEFQCENESAAGLLRLGCDRARVHADENGRFEIVIPRTSRRTVRVYLFVPSSPVLTRSLDDCSLGEETLELDIP